MGKILCFLIIVGIAFGFFATYGNAMPYNEERTISEGRLELSPNEEEFDHRDARLHPDLFCDAEQRQPTEDCRCVDGLWQCDSVDLLRKSRSTGSRLRRETPLTAELKNTPCAPNDYFQVDCNTCYCKIDRTGYLCTENISCEESIESSTTTNIPMSDGAMLVLSDRGAQLIKDSNTNDNNLSRIPKTFTESERTTPIRSENNLGNNLEASTAASALANN